ncbi:hypothetical protein BBK36DRAFT_1164787 [Trichoderma citrinoviride]|uniref:Uncharacterized protein n=1 Tax=Trichoderma citrinoviride TaxID=58853 RepID=A0A2T4BLP1_9HYPO|nr:hypothetical protein BBK36DRAFT_1164787 [Trichoderma citrinoviride]PTB70235.1 hypothetical protein BBK36DRAFT_1164787 [Trichoderma citrinoviride]
MTFTSPELLQSAIDAHGGQEYWDSIESLNVELEFSGPALRMRGLPGPYQIKMVVDTKTKKVTFEKFGDYYGSWTPTRTEVGKIGTAEDLDVRENPRDVFDTHVEATPWDMQNLFYFVGYAFWNYVNFPFYLEDPEIQTREVDGPTRENGEEWTTLEVVFPDGYPTHTKFQKFDFDAGYRLMRMHYKVDVVKKSVPVWHSCFNHAVAGKLLYPSLRIVTSSFPGTTFFSPFLLKDIKIDVNHKFAETR